MKIDGINVQIFKCDDCGCPEIWIFRGDKGEGFKLACSKCGKDQRQLLEEMKLPYLWRHLEKEERVPVSIKEER